MAKLLGKEGITVTEVLRVGNWWRYLLYGAVLGGLLGPVVVLLIARLGGPTIPMIAGVAVTGLLLGAIGAGIGSMDDRRTRRFPPRAQPTHRGQARRAVRGILRAAGA